MKKLQRDHGFTLRLRSVFRIPFSKNHFFIGIKNA